MKGRVPSHEQINIISNHKSDPVNWNAPEIAKLLNMREMDVSNIIKYYRLIDDAEVDHIEPPNMEWSQENKCWMVGEPLPENPTEKLGKKFDRKIFDFQAIFDPKITDFRRF